MLERVGQEHRAWLKSVWNTSIQHEPITADDGEILAQPVFWYWADGRRIACFGTEEPGAYTMHKLEDNKVDVIRAGQELPS